MRQSETEAQDSGPEASLLESPGVIHQPAVPRDPPDPEGRKRAQVTQVSGIKKTGRFRACRPAWDCARNFLEGLSPEGRA